MSTDYWYDENLPYVVESVVRDEGGLIARFARRNDAEHAVKQAFCARVIDTTPKPRVPDDAEHITWEVDGEHLYAKRSGDWWRREYQFSVPLHELYGVTPETVFTVLDVRKW